MNMYEPHTVDGHDITDEAIAGYQARGFIRVRGIISPGEASRFREAVLRVAQQAPRMQGETPVFRQVVNAWRMDETVSQLTLHPNIGAVAARLTGRPMRLWHDHILIKAPHNKAPTFFHQDQQYWPHDKESANISCWVALCDVPPVRGCMSFIPGFHRRTELAAQDLRDPRSLFKMCPELEYAERVTLPLRAGDCTFHDGRCPHMANENATDEPRVALSVIMMGRDTQFEKKPHVVADPLNLSEGQVISGDLFPDVGADAR